MTLDHRNNTFLIINTVVNPQERGGTQRHVDVSDGKGQIKTRAHRKIGKHKFD